jgi:peptide/nickel transport system permease protein
MMRKNELLRHFLKSPSALLSAAVVLAYVLVAILANCIAPQDTYDLSTLSLRDALKPPIWMSGGKAPFILGTDRQGRDVLSTILFGLRSSLSVGFLCVALAGTFGGLVGLFAGYYEGKLSMITMRAADVVFSFPATLVAILLMGLVGKRGVLVVVLAIAAIYWVRYARTMRSKVLAEKEKEYVQAARSIGNGDFRILWRHLLPNCISPLIVIGTVDIAVVIMLEATLSFLGVGVPITEPSLGQLIFVGKNFLQAGKWWLVVFPGGVLVFFVVAVNVLGDWLRLELSPRIHSS